jgi:hypothetical protein
LEPCAASTRITVTITTTPKFYIDALPLSEEDRRKIFETSARRVYRLDRTDLFKRRG